MVATALRYSLEQTTVRRTALTLLDLNQTKGFDWGIRSQMPMARSPRTLLWPRTGHTERHAEGFRLIAHPTAPGCAAACCPQTDVLVPLDSTAGISDTPTSKGIVVGPERTTIGAAGATATAPRSDGP
ncbi:hypothetical protein [Streptomyces atratus]|uniref:hypothetical protein n=1 Tax=Streptomyces atratus TaxID=1893 RepID=UPI0038D05ED1